MYQYVRAFLRKRGKNQQWASVDISGMQVSVVLRDYIAGYVTVTNTALGAGERYVDILTLKQFRTPYSAMPFSSWLGITGFPILPELPSEPQFEIADALYSDAVQAGYLLRACKNDIIPILPEFENYIDNSVEVLPLSARTDLAMSKPNIDMHLLQRTALVSINGFYHRSTMRGPELQVVDGSRNMLRSRTPDVAITSFANIGDITQVDITPEMVLTGNPVEPGTQYEYQYGAYLATGIDLTDKSVMFVLGGYLHVEDTVYDVVNKSLGIVKVNFNKLNIPQRIFETMPYMDLDYLNLTQSMVREGAISVPEVYSNAFLLRYLTMSQSFMVVVDTPSLHRTKTLVEHTGLPGVYDCPTEPKYPLKTRYGRLITYWTRRAEELFILETDQVPAYDYLHNTTSWRTERVVNNTRLPLPNRQMDCYLEGIHGMRQV